MDAVLVVLEHCGSRSDAYRSAAHERDEAVAALLEGIRHDVESIPGDEETARQFATLPSPTEVLRREDIRQIHEVQAAIAEHVRKRSEERERQEKMRQVQSLAALAQQLTEVATPEKLDMVSPLVEQFSDSFPLSTPRPLPPHGWTSSQRLGDTPVTIAASSGSSMQFTF